MKIRYSIALCFLTLLAACAQSAPPTKVRYEALIESDVPNARVEINDDYVGTTPLRYTWTFWSNSPCFGKFWESTTIVVTLQQGSEVYQDRKYFWGGSTSCENRDRIPRRLYFTTGAPKLVTDPGLLAILNGEMEQPAKTPDLPEGFVLDIPEKPKKQITSKSGSGFFVNDDGYIVTNAHVVEGCYNVRVYIRTPDPPEGFVLDNPSMVMVQIAGTVRERNNPKDLAVVKTAYKNLDHATFYSNLSINSGTKIVAVGYPLRGLLATEPHISFGSITATKGLLDNPDHFQVSTPIQPGNSGGPVMDLSGNVIGVIFSTIDTVAVAKAIGTIPQNVNFAINGNTLMRYLRSVNINFSQRGRILSGAAALYNSEENVADKAKNFTVSLECTGNPVQS